MQTTQTIVWAWPHVLTPLSVTTHTVISWAITLWFFSDFRLREVCRNILDVTCQRVYHKENKKNAYFSNWVFSYFVKHNFEVSKVWHTVLTQRYRLHVLYPSETVSIAIWFTPYKLLEQVHQSLYPLLPPSFHSTIAGKCKSNSHKFCITLCPHSQKTAQFHQWGLIMRQLAWIFDNLTKYGIIQLQKAKPPQHWVDSVHSL